MAISPIDASNSSMLYPCPGQSPPAVTSVDGAASTDGSASVSSFGKLFGQLQQLNTTDPSKFHSILTEIASQLDAAASKDGGTQGDALAQLASRFDQAAQSGDLSALRPLHHHGHHHGGHGYPPATTGTATPSGATDPRAQALGIVTQVLNQDLGSTVASK